MAAGEDALLDPRLQRRRAVAPDRMYEPPAAPPEAALHDAPERRVVLDADVLEHSDRHEGVVLTGDVAVIVLDVLETIGEALACRPLACPANLLVRDVEGAHAYAVMARHVHRQHPPATSGLDHALAGPEAKLAAHVVHLRDLRLIERGGRLGVVRTGVRHGRAEPQLVERVADVVVVMDVVPRANEGVAVRAWAVQRIRRAARERVALAAGAPTGTVD